MLKVLREIRDEVKANGQEIQETNVRLGRLEAGMDRLDERVESLEHRQTETEMRLATELIAVAHAVEGVKDLLRDRLDVRDKVEDHERRIATLEGRSH
jgi:chromosome segregation ATPase